MNFSFFLCQRSPDLPYEGGIALGSESDGIRENAVHMHFIITKY